MLQSSLCVHMRRRALTAVVMSTSSTDTMREEGGQTKTLSGVVVIIKELLGIIFCTAGFLSSVTSGREIYGGRAERAMAIF